MTRILLADDDLALLRVLRRLMIHKGHDVFTAGSGLEALHIADNERIDVAIVDHHMPGMSGLEVIQRLHALQPGCVRILSSGRLDLPMIMRAIKSMAHLRWS